MKRISGLLAEGGVPEGCVGITGSCSLACRAVFGHRSCRLRKVLVEGESGLVKGKGRGPHPRTGRGHVEADIFQAETRDRLR